MLYYLVGFCDNFVGNKNALISSQLEFETNIRIKLVSLTSNKKTKQKQKQNKQTKKQNKKNLKTRY